MLIAYNIGIQLYSGFIYLASFFNRKARLWINGRKNNSFLSFSNSIWFHFASLGEFEQGSPVLERLRILYPQNKIVVTFFSPSGYEVKKSTPLANAVYYLPLDTAKNARQFIDAIQPKIAVFTKYEYWYHYFKEMHTRNIPIYVISGIFRPKQVFFKWYGGLHRKMLTFVTCFFVQDESSKQLLQNLGITNVKVSGDTRFDRVMANAVYPKLIPEVNAFKNQHKIFIAGSTWPRDEKLVAALVTQFPGWKFIFAPHEVNEVNINNLINILPKGNVMRYSQIVGLTTPILNFNVLIIDNIGMLRSLYQYGDLAYIGGGFGAGIHNTLEAAAFGLPVIFGPNYSKFNEAIDVIKLKAGFCINDDVQLKAIIHQLITDKAFYNNAANAIKTYVKEHTGGTSIIIKNIADRLDTLYV